MPAAPADLLAYEARLRAAAAEPGALEGTAQALTVLTNGYRSQRGLPPLADHPGLALAARGHVADLAARNYFEHASPEGFEASQRIGLLARGLCGFSGENLALRRHGRGQPTPRQFLDQWITSPGHRANLVREGYTHVGHAVLQRGDRTYAAAAYASQMLRLDPALPLRLSGGEALRRAVQEGAAQTSQFQLSRPDGSAVQGPWPAGAAPPAAPGAWRLRPLVPETERSFLVLWGPIFVIG